MLIPLLLMQTLLLYLALGLGANLAQLWKAKFVLHGKMWFRL